MEIVGLQVQQHGRRFEVQAESLMSAPPAFIYAALADYDNFHRLSGGLAETRWLERPVDGRGLAYTRIDSCVLFFCKVIERVEQVVLEPGRAISTTIVPERSDFRVYSTRWTIEEAGGSTRLHFQATMEPDFWLPPVIGKWALRRKLETSARRIGERIERLHQEGRDLAELQLPATAATAR